MGNENVVYLHYGILFISEENWNHGTRSCSWDVMYKGRIHYKRKYTEWGSPYHEDICHVFSMCGL